MPDYSKSKIYKIVCNITGLVYIGSTTQNLCGRIQDHKNDYKRYLNGKHNYVSSFKILENDNYNIVLVEEFPCQNKNQLHARERYWIENTECVNMIIPTRTKKEWREDHKEEIKIYLENNKEKISERWKQYYETNKEKLNEKKKEYLLKNKEKLNENKGKIKEYNKQYRLKNKEILKIYDKQKYLKNKEKISEYNKQKYLKNKEKTKPPENLI
jgi:hypothetical protein